MLYTDNFRYTEKHNIPLEWHERIVVGATLAVGIIFSVLFAIFSSLMVYIVLTYRTYLGYNIMSAFEALIFLMPFFSLTSTILALLSFFKIRRFKRSGVVLHIIYVFWTHFFIVCMLLLFDAEFVSSYFIIGLIICLVYWQLLCAYYDRRQVLFEKSSKKTEVYSWDLKELYESGILIEAVPPYDDK